MERRLFAASFLLNNSKLLKKVNHFIEGIKNQSRNYGNISIDHKNKPNFSNRLKDQSKVALIEQ